MIYKEVARQIADRYEVHLQIIAAVATVMLSRGDYMKFARTINSLNRDMWAKNHFHNKLQMRKNGFSRIN